MTYSKANEVFELANSTSGTITLAEAARKLGYGSSRGVAKLISSAYWFFQRSGESWKADRISETFVDRYYRFPWEV